MRSSGPEGSGSPWSCVYSRGDVNQASGQLWFGVEAPSVGFRFVVYRLAYSLHCSSSFGLTN